MGTPKKTMTREEAGMSYLAAHVAYRDAVRLLSIGLAACTEETSQRLKEEPRTLDDAIVAVAITEAADLVELFERDPSEYPQGRTPDLAFADRLKNAKRRFRNGKCALCKGPALPCAIRHARGRSCA